jgi:hypothetical protein
MARHTPGAVEHTDGGVGASCRVSSPGMVRPNSVPQWASPGLANVRIGPPRLVCEGQVRKDE